MGEGHGAFARAVDELVEMSAGDAELAEGLRWLDERARRRGATIYDEAFEVLYGAGARPTGAAWLASRN